MSSCKKSESKIAGEHDFCAAPPAPPAREELIAFGNTIRITLTQFHRWEGAFKHLDLRAELTALDHWAGRIKAKGGNWFAAVANALAKRNREVKARIEAARAGNGVGAEQGAVDNLAGASSHALAALRRAQKSGRVKPGEIFKVTKGGSIDHYDVSGRLLGTFTGGAII